MYFTRFLIIFGRHRGRIRGRITSAANEKSEIRTVLSIDRRIVVERISNSAQRCQTVLYSHHGVPRVWEAEGQLEMENVEKGRGQTRRRRGGKRGQARNS